MISKNIVFPKRETIELISEEVPSLGYGEILCQAETSLISIGTETLCLRGVFDKGTYWEDYIKYPFHPGYSMAARVIDVGEGVTRWKIGDRITSWSEHRQFFVIPENDAFPIPEKISNEEAVWATLARTTQLGVRRAQLSMGETAAVIGMGMLGQLVIQYLRICGAKRIFAIDTSAARLELAKKNGATDVLQMDIREAKGEIARLTDGKMVDVVFDITGHPAVLAPATELLRKLGRLILLGDSTTPSQQHLGPRVVGDSIAILGIHGMMYPDSYSVFNPWTAAEMSSLFFEYILQGRMNVKNLITTVYSPEQAAEVYGRLLTDRSNTMGVLFDWAQIK